MLTWNVAPVYPCFVSWEGQEANILEIAVAEAEAAADAISPFCSSLCNTSFVQFQI